MYIRSIWMDWDIDVISEVVHEHSMLIELHEQLIDTELQLHCGDNSVLGWEKFEKSLHLQANIFVFNCEKNIYKNKSSTAGCL